MKLALTPNINDRSLIQEESVSLTALNISLVAALARNGVIGGAHGMPWHLPGDLAHFRELTRGKPVIMGRKTFATIGRPLKERTNIVVTHDLAIVKSAGVLAADSVTAAISLAIDAATKLGVPEVMVMGGGEIYAQTIGMAHFLYLTWIETEAEGNVYFPKLRRDEWREISKSAPQKTELDSHYYYHETLKRAEN